MNALQTFLAAANVQSRATVMEEFTIAGVNGTFLGTFGDPQMVPIMTRSGYQDHLVTLLKAEAVQFSAAPTSRVNLVRTQTGRTFFVHMVDATQVVVYNFMLTDREL